MILTDDAVVVITPKPVGHSPLTGIRLILTVTRDLDGNDVLTVIVP